MKLPRKLKKKILGDRLSQTKIRKLIKEMKVTPAKGADPTLVEPYEFCPKCGCCGIRWFNHGAEYPERWVSGYCMRCDNKVMESDNSPYVHVLELEGFTFN